jgi:hypothetical protein
LKTSLKDVVYIGLNAIALILAKTALIDFWTLVAPF